MFIPSLINLYLINKGLGDPAGLSGRYKAAKDSLFRRLGYQPITTPTTGANTTPAPVAAPNQAPAAAPATTPVTAPVSNPVSSTSASAPSVAPTSPSLPSGALTAEGGGAISFQAPSVNIPEFNTNPQPAAAPSMASSQAPASAYKDAPATSTTSKPTPEEIKAIWDRATRAAMRDTFGFSSAKPPAAQAVKNPFSSSKNTTGQPMNPYSNNTGANTMKPNADRWKAYQTMNSSRSSSNADRYTAKNTNVPDKVVNPVTAKSKY